MTHIEICRGTASHTAAVARLIATAFAPLDIAKWLVPNRADRVRVLAAQFAILIEDALHQGAVLLGSHGPAAMGFHAVAVGYQPARPLPPPADYDARLAEACGENLERFERLDDAFDQRHPHSYPHHYLSYLATAREHQGHGLGTALLRHILHQVDHAVVPAYLVASNERTREFYTHFGYQQSGGPLRLPGGPVMWPMRREPQTLTEPDLTRSEMSTMPSASGNR